MKNNKLGMNQAHNEDLRPLVVGCLYSRPIHIYKAMCNLYICKYIILILAIF